MGNSELSASHLPAHETGRIDEKELVRKAQAGDISSQFGLAYLYAGGFDFPNPDPERARYWRQRAAFQTTPATMAAQARAYIALDSNQGQDEIAAWLYEAARGGDTNAAYQRALLLLNVEARKTEAENIMGRLACDGYLPAQIVCVNMNLYSQIIEQVSKKGPGESSLDCTFRREVRQAFNQAPAARRRILEVSVTRRAEAGSKLARLVRDLGAAIAAETLEEDSVYKLLLRAAEAGNLAAAFFLLNSPVFRFRAWTALDRKKIGLLARENAPVNHAYAQLVAQLLDRSWEFESEYGSARAETKPRVN